LGSGDGEGGHEDGYDGLDHGFFCTCVHAALISATSGKSKRTTTLLS
jgi:hypothetical protein